jgi:ABC-type antimicrobial peptide transport system permease subunit
VSWIDALRLAISGVARRLGRAVLTIGGVALAVTLLVALLTIESTGRTRVLDQLSKGGPLAGIKVSAGHLDDFNLHRIRGLADVASAEPVLGIPIAVLPPDPPTYQAARADPSPAGTGPFFLDSLIGVDLAHQALLPVTVIVGRLPAARSATEVAVTQGYLQRLGLGTGDPSAVLGTQVELGAAELGSAGRGFPSRWTRATVVGVVAQDAGDGSVLGPIALARAARAFEQPDRPETIYSAALVEARSLDQVAAARSEIEDLGFVTSAPENLIATVMRYLHVVEIVLGAIGLIALGIAALGVANALVAAVRERRREIGVLKAIGARDRDVLAVFLFESALVGFAGGAVGVVVGWATARTVAAVVNAYLIRQGLAGVAVGFPLRVLLGGLLGAVVLSVAAGALPAVRAAHLPAREAVAEG